METRPPPECQLSIEVVQGNCVVLGCECSLLGFSRGAFWASYFALHMPWLSKLALLGYYPEPGEDDRHSQSHGAALKMPTLLLMSEADACSPAAKAKPCARGLESCAQELRHLVLFVEQLSHGDLWTIADASGARSGKPQVSQLHARLWHCLVGCHS